MNRWCPKGPALACLAIVFFVAGCSGGTAGGPDASKLVPVTGIVKLDGKPLADATVNFLPKTSAGPGFYPAMGTTDQSGKYELVVTAADGKTLKGVVPGEYNVAVSKLVKPDGTPVKFDGSLGGPMNQAAMEMIPMRYATIGEGGMSYTVPAGGGTNDIEMEAGGGP